MKKLLFVLLAIICIATSCKKETVEPEVPVENYIDDIEYIKSVNSWILIVKLNPLVWKFQEMGSNNYVLVRPSPKDDPYIKVGHMVPGIYLSKLKLALPYYININVNGNMIKTNFKYK